MSRLSAWRFVVVFGVVSLLADVVYEGARSITGPLLASLGAGAVVVGTVTGVGEAAALVLRLVSGTLTDRTRRFWAWTIAGYAVTVVAVPLLGVVGVLWAAAALVITERVGKAVRSPAKDTLLSHATAVTGRGRGFAVHEALDQIGALLGPLVVGGMLALTGGDYGPALAVLAVPGVGVMALLLWLRARVPDPAAYEEERPEHSPDGAPEPPPEQAPDAAPTPSLPDGAARRPGWLVALPRVFWVYAAFSALAILGFATFGLVSFHMVETDVVPVAWVPVVYAAAMVADALAAVASGWAYDRVGGARVLVVVPVLTVAATALAFGGTLAAVLAGTMLWGAALGIQESTMRAVVADLVPTRRRATAYGLYAAVVGGAAAVGGAALGALYEASVGTLVAGVAVVEALALVLLAATYRRQARSASEPGSRL